MQLSKKNSLAKLIKQENYDPFYTPMTTATAAMLESLTELTNVDPKLSSIAYHSQLIKCQLDYSLSSLKRLDKFVIALRQFRHIEHLELADDSSIRSLFVCLIAYVGEVFARARGQSALWFALEEVDNFASLDKLVKYNFPDIWKAIGVYPEGTQIPEIERAFLVLFSLDTKLISQRNVGYFLPVKPIYENLVGNPITTIYDFVVEYLEAVHIPKPVDDYIPKVPKVFLDIDLQDELRLLLPEQRYYLQVKKPHWMQEDDELYTQISNLGNLYKNGKIVWAVLVQANKQLFNTVKNNEPNGYPAEILYDPTGRTHIRELLNCKQYASELETMLPKSLNLLSLKKSTTFIWRLHLPNGLLSMGFFPILIDENREGITTILPSRFWDDEFVQSWLSTAAKDHNQRSFDLSDIFIEKENVGLPVWTLSDTTSIEELTSNNLYPNLLKLFPDHQFVPTQSNKSFDINRSIIIPPKEDFFVLKNRGYEIEAVESSDKSLELSLEQDIPNYEKSNIAHQEVYRTEGDQLDTEMRCLIQKVGENKKRSNGVIDLISKYPLLLVFVSMSVIWVIRKIMNI